MTSNPLHFSTLSDSTKQMQDNIDFLHSGIAQGLATAIEGNYVVSGCDVTQSSVGGTTRFTVSLGKYKKDHTLTDFTAASSPYVDLDSVAGGGSPHPTSGYAWYGLLVITGVSTVVIRNRVGGTILTGSLNPQIPDYTQGDVIIGVIKVDGSTTADLATRPFQFLTYHTDDAPTSLWIKETDTPTNIDDWGAIYCKNDDKLYFQDGAGTEHDMMASGSTQNLFETIAVSGEANIVADGATDTLTVAAGTGITLTTAAGTDTLTVTNSSPNVDQNLFQTITCPNGTNPAADTTTDTLALTEGVGITITGNSGTDTIDFAVDVSDFLTNGANNYVVTATGTDAMNAEANMQFDGTTLAVTGNITASTKLTTGGELNRELLVSSASGVIGSPRALAATTIQVLDTAPAATNFFIMPPVGGDVNLIITLVNGGAGDAIITPAASEEFNAGQATNPASTYHNLIPTPNTMVLPKLAFVTLVSYTDGTIPSATMAAPAGTFGTGWLVIGYGL